MLETIQLTNRVKLLELSLIGQLIFQIDLTLQYWDVFIDDTDFSDLKNYVCKGCAKNDVLIDNNQGFSSFVFF